MKSYPQPKVSAHIALAASMILAVFLLTGCASAGPEAADPTCGRSLQDLIDSADPGAVVEAAGGCVYRETVDIDKPITLKAAPGGSEIRGSDVWDAAAWSRQDSTWMSRKTVPRLAIDSNWKCEPEIKRCRWPEQVFVDGRQLTQVAVGTTPEAGQFRLNAGRRVILGESPIGKTVEVTVRDHWVVGIADVADVTDATDVTIDGFTMMHAASDGVLNSGNDDWTIENGDYSYAHTSDVLIKRATGALVSDNKIHHAGQKGVAGNEVDLMLQGNEIYANNTENFNSSWNAGGVKISQPRTVTFAGNTVYDNRGNGLWLDVPTEDQVLVVRDNRVHHNDANGIRSEVTDDDVQIFDNVVWENGWARSGSKAAGISLNASQNNHVYNNVVAWNANGIRVINSLRSEVHPEETEYDFVYNVEVDHNEILMDGPPDDAYALGWVKTVSNGNLYDPAANNRGHSNSYWYPTPEGSQKRYAWDVEFDSLGAFNDTLGEENARYLSGAEKDGVVTANSIPNVSPPSGCTITGTPADDVISGTPARDKICAGGGKDTLKGLAGNDTLRGGGGSDTVRGGMGGDRVMGGGGADSLYGDDGADAVNSNDGIEGNDRLDGGAGTDTKVTDATEKSIVGFP